MYIEKNVEIIASGSVLHYIDSVNGDYIQSSGSSVEGVIKGILFSFNIPSSHFAFLKANRLITRLMRLNRMNVLVLGKLKLLVIYNFNVYVFDIATNSLKRTYEFERTRYVHTQSISYDGNKIVVGEYGTVGQNKEVGVIISTDAGERWIYKPLFKRGETKNILAIKYDNFSKKYWVFTGDKPKDSGVYIFDADFNLIKNVGVGLTFRAISSHFTSTRVIWLTNNPFGVSQVITYERDTEEIVVRNTLPGPVWYSTSVGERFYCSTAAEDSMGNEGKAVFILESNDFINWKILCKFIKDRFNKRLFLYGLATFPYHHNVTTSLYMNLDAVTKFDGKTVKITEL